MHRVFGLLLLVVIGGGVAAGQETIKRSPLYTMTYDGLERSYRLYVPERYDGSAVPLVMALHGGGGNARNMESLTFGRFNTLAEEQGFIVLYPEGIGRNWNDGRDDVNSRAHRENVDDVGFMAALIDQLSSAYNIDPARIYSTGISNGAIMSFRLACELSDRIAAIAPVVGFMPESIVDTCQPNHPVSVLLMAGTDDPLVPYEGGIIRLGETLRGNVLSAQETVKWWAEHNGCAVTPAIEPLPDTNPDDGTTIEQTLYDTCEAGAKVALYTVQGGGHTWPGGWQYFDESLIGKTNRDVVAADVIWAFFKTHKSDS